METNPLVSIIIVNFNGKQLLSDCLNSVLENHYKNYEIILVDNNSTDGSIELISENFPFVKIIKLSDNHGFSYPNNLAAKKAKGEFLLFLNNDTTITKDSISELINILKNNDSIGICQSLLLRPNGEIDSSGDFLHVLGLPYCSTQKIVEPRKILSARGAALFSRRDLFQKLGGFNEKFFATFEDVDLCWRSWIYGKEVQVIPNSIVYHKGSETIKKIETKIESHSFNNFLLLNILNLESNKIPRFIFSLPKILFVNKKSDSLRNMKPASLKQIIFGFVWILKNLPYIQKTRKTINSKRTISTNQLMELGLIQSDFE